MSIHFEPKGNLIQLDTDHTTYQMQIDENGYLLHLYYGTFLGRCSMEYVQYYSDCGFSPNPYPLRDRREFSLDTVSQEYTGSDIGDYRISCLSLQNPDGSYSADFRYVSHRITDGKYELDGLPSAYDGSGKAQTLTVDLKDRVTGMELRLLYGVYEKEDVITRSAEFINGTKGQVWLYRASSMCLDIPFGTWDYIHFPGRHTMERQVERRAALQGIATFSSRRGSSSHQHNPFLILADPDTCEAYGECYGVMLVYSGSYRIDAELSQMGSTRITAGLNDQQFKWQLNQGEHFVMPEVLLSFTDKGLTKLSQQYAGFIQDNICRGTWKDRRRPVLINNWEATYFDFHTEKLLKLAGEARELGIEMLALDDGWFGRRNDELDGLGDWKVNREKLPEGLPHLIGKVNELGMKFGIWVEPEMVSEASDLYQSHPEWALTAPGREPVLGRAQLVLDMGREDVQEYLFGCLDKLLSENNIEYVKWDMNRHMADIYSSALPLTRQGEAGHRYMLGVYALLRRLTARHPHVLFETCSGGGGRFDCGMLCYSPQIWCSDNTDAIERMKIQYGTSFGYPVCTIGAHVSAVPNHQTGRTVPLHTRGIVAMSGTFGYELDISLLSREEKEEIKEQIKTFKNYYWLIQKGHYYRLTDAIKDRYFTAWELADREGREALLNVVVTSPQGNPTPIHVRLKGLKPEAIYVEESGKKKYKGSGLMYGGYTLPILKGDYPAVQYHFVEEGYERMDGNL